MPSVGEFAHLHPSYAGSLHEADLLALAVGHGLADDEAPGEATLQVLWTPIALVYFRLGGVMRYVVRRLPTDATG